jgi:leucyl-tRNA synthetase
MKIEVIFSNNTPLFMVLLHNFQLSLSPQTNSRTMTYNKRTFITSALPYANGPVHIGHLAGVYVPADYYARFLRLNGEEVAFIGGFDEHGVPITLKAKRRRHSPGCGRKIPCDN